MAWIRPPSYFNRPPEKYKRKPMAKPVRDPDILHGKDRKGQGNERYYLGSGAPRKLISFDNMTVKARQNFLRRQGYNIAKDGVLGPQTKAATRAWRNKVGAAVFNRRLKGTPSGPSNPVQLHDDVAPVSAGGGGGHSHGGGGGGGRAARGRGGGGGGAAPTPVGAGLIDAQKYARSSVEQEYGPMLGQLQRDISLQRRQGSQNIADVTEWFKQLEATRAQGEAGNRSALERALGGFDAANLGITNALGGAANEAGAQAAGYAAAERGGLAGMGQAQGDFDRRMGAILASQGVDARRGLQNQQSQIMEELLGKRMDLFKAKGSALSKARAEAEILRTQQRGQNIEQETALQQLGLERDMAPLKMAQARLGLQQGRQQLGLNARNQRISEQERQLDYDVKRAQYEDFLDQLQQQSGGKGLNFNELDEQSRLGMANSIRGLASGPGGRFVGSVTQTWKKIQDGLRMAGYDVNNPAIRRFGLSIMRTIPGYGRAARAKNRKR
jgi:hypothetical protein